MGALEDAIYRQIANEFSAGTDVVSDVAAKQIVAENPYNMFSSIAQNAGQAAIQAYTANPQAVDPLEMIGISAISGLLGGTMQGFGQNYENTLRDRYIQSRKDLAMGGTGEVEDLPTSLFNIAKTENALFKIKQAQEAKGLYQDVFKSQLTKAATEGDFLEKMSATERANIMGSQGTLSAIRRMADRFEALKLDPASLQLTRWVPGSEAYDLFGEIPLLVGPVLKLSAESGNFAISERAATLSSMKGTALASSDDIARRLREVADLYQGIVVERLESAKTAYSGGPGGGGDALLQALKGKTQDGGAAGGMQQPATSTVARKVGDTWPGGGKIIERRVVSK